MVFNRDITGLDFSSKLTKQASDLYLVNLVKSVCKGSISPELKHFLPDKKFKCYWSNLSLQTDATAPCWFHT